MKIKSEFHKCYFCGSAEFVLSAITISVGFERDDYSFCVKCLNGMTAHDFWKHMYDNLNYVYPAKLIEWVENEANYSSQHARKISFITRTKIKKRNGMSNALRYEIMRRDNFHCVLCGATGKDDVLQVDHIKPASKGGDENKDNLRTTCRKCNSGKSDKVE